MANKKVTTVVATDNTVLPVFYVDVKGDGTSYALQTASAPTDASGNAITSSNPGPVTLATTSAGEDQALNRLNVVGVDATGNVNKWAINAAGQMLVVTESPRKTYTLAGFVTPAATPTDVIQIAGAAGVVVRLVHVAISVESTAAGIADVALIRRSATDTGGTSSAPTIGRHATADGAPSAAVLVWTANPTGLGATVATLGVKKVAGTSNPLAEWRPSSQNDKAFQIVGASEFFCVNGNGDTLLAGEVWGYEITWTESAD